MLLKNLNTSSIKIFFALFIYGLLFFAGNNTASAKSWYVRPASGSYGAENGTSYANAWDGWNSIVWGNTGVVASDTIYLCGNHSFSASISLGQTNATTKNRITISGACPNIPGTITFSGNSFLNINKNYFDIKKLTLTASPTSPGVYQQKSFVTYDKVIFNGGTYGINFANTGTITNTTVQNCSFNGQSLVGIKWFVYDNTLSALKNTLIQNNTFSNILTDAIEIRSEEDAPNAQVSSLTILNNVFSNCGRSATRIFGKGAFATYSWKNILIKNNIIKNHCSGFGVGGFGAESFGTNEISGNIISGTAIASGGIDVFYNKYLDIFNNVINKGTTDTVDGNGILIDMGNDTVRVHNNIVTAMTGKNNVNNSGVGIMILDSINISAYNNTGVGNRIGLWLGNTNTLANAPANIDFYNNRFINNLEAGIWVSPTVTATNDRKLLIRKNVFTGDGSGFAINDFSLGGATSNWTNGNIYRGFSLP